MTYFYPNWNQLSRSAQATYLFCAFMCILSFINAAVHTVTSVTICRFELLWACVLLTMILAIISRKWLVIPTVICGVVFMETVADGIVSFLMTLIA